MLLRFYVSNFMSFFDEVEFNMFPSAFKTHKEHVYSESKVSLLKAAAVYGANGSGKSNFIKAVHFLHDVVVTGDLTKCEVKCAPFRLNEAGVNMPSVFGMEFQIGKRVFEYTVSVKDDKITEESLYETNPAKETAEYVFERQTTNGKTHIKVHPKWTKTEKERLRFEIYEEDLMPGQSLIFKLKSKLDYATEIVNWFENHVWILYPQTKYLLTLRLCMDAEYKDFLNRLLPSLGTGMDAIDIEKIPFPTFFGKDDEEKRREFEDRLNNNKDFVLFFKKNRKEYIARKENDGYVVNKIKTFNPGESGSMIEFEPEEQSDGTRRMLDLIPAIQKMTNEASVFFVDEIDRSLHPSMTKSLMEYFMAHQTKGQMVFTTHESNMLDLEIFRQDEIWFTEKDPSGATKMYPLSDYKPRYDLDIRKGYLAGRFGAIPFLGNLKDLNWQHAQKQEL